MSNIKGLDELFEEYEAEQREEHQRWLADPVAQERHRKEQEKSRAEWEAYLNTRPDPDEEGDTDNEEDEEDEEDTDEEDGEE